MAPVRTCVGCRRTASTDVLLRIARLPGGELVVSRTAPGRGAWLCRGASGCLDRAAERKALERALRAAVGREQVESLRDAVESASRTAAGQNTEEHAP